MTTPDHRAVRYGRVTINDDDPITFPPPLGATQDNSADHLPLSGEIIIDPYGGLYCFVCRVNVPRGLKNIEQHMYGKRHEQNDRRFPDSRTRLRIRDRYLQAVREHKRTQQPSHNKKVPSQPTSLSALPNPVSNRPHVTPDFQRPCDSPPVSKEMQQPTQASQMSEFSTPQVSGLNSIGAATLSFPSSDMQNNHGTTPVPSTDLTPLSDKTPPPPKNHECNLTCNHSHSCFETRQQLRKEKAERARLAHDLTKIDKKFFLDDILKDSDESSDDPNRHGEDDDDDDDNHTPMRNYDSRRNLTGPLTYKPPEGPDYFFESMVPETPRSDTAALLHEVLAAAPNASDRKAETTVDKAKTTDYIPLAAKNKELEDRREKQLQTQQSLDDCITLRDTNGEMLPPWLLDPVATESVLYTADSSIALHFEILQFMRFMSPTQLEKQARKDMIMTIETIAKSLWVDCRVEVFGSYATGLALPSSDVDICIMNTPNRGSISEFNILADAARNVAGFAKRVQVVEAKVPIVKIISRRTSMNCDISIGVDNGVKNVPRILRFIEQFPALRPLLLVVKCFLHQRAMNEVYTGGLGSYTLLLMVVSHLQMMPYNFPVLKANLGNQLKSFFDLYGNLLNFAMTGIQVRDTGRYYYKFDRYPLVPGEVTRYSVEDPSDETNELGRNGFNAHHIRRACLNASFNLMEWRRDDGSNSPTPLGTLIHVDEEFMTRRRAVIEDLERQGENPLRNELSAIHPSNKRKDQTLSTESNDAAIASGWDAALHMQSPTMENKRSSRRPNSSPGRRWDRDPRLGKRRRISKDEGDELYLHSNVVVNATDGPLDTVKTFTELADMKGDIAAPGNGHPQQTLSAATPGYTYSGMPVYRNGDSSVPTDYPLHPHRSSRQPLPPIDGGGVNMQGRASGGLQANRDTANGRHGRHRSNFKGHKGR